jgi:hypothetical protein
MHPMGWVMITLWAVLITGAWTGSWKALGALAVLVLVFGWIAWVNSMEQ